MGNCKIIAVVNQKGGVGKSSLAIGLSVELVARGFRVCLGDADPQASAQGWAALAVKTGQPTPVVVGLGKHFHNPGQIDQLAAGYDFLIIDTPPHSGETMRSALAVAELAVLPVIAGAFDAWALGDSLDLVRRAQTLRPHLKTAVVLNRSTATREASAREMLAQGGVTMLKTSIGQRVDVADATAAGLGPTTYAPRGKAAAEWRSLCSEILSIFNENDPLPLAG